MPTIDRRAIYERDRGLCGFCGQPVPFSKLDIDHAVPRAFGGSDDPSNLRAAHRRCNRGQAAVIARTLHPPRPTTAATVRFTAELHQQLTDYADEHGRPFTAQVLYWLRHDLELAARGEHPKP